MSSRQKNQHKPRHRTHPVKRQSLAEYAPSRMLPPAPPKPQPPAATETTPPDRG